MVKKETKRIFIYHSRDTIWVEEQIKQKISILGTSKEKAYPINLCFPEDSPAKAIDSLNALSLTKEQNIVCINNYDQGLKKNDLVKLIDACNEESLLFLRKEEPKFNSPAFEKTARNRQEIEIIVEYFIKKDRIKTRLNKFSQENKIYFEAAATEKLLFFFLKNPSLWKNEMEKIALYFYKEKEKVTVENLNDLIYWTNSKMGEFSILDSLIARKKESIALLEEYLNQRGSFLMIIILMQKEYKKILRFKELMEKNLPQEKIWTILSIYYTKEKNALLQRNQTHTLDLIARIIEGLVEIEKILKSEDFHRSSVGQASINLKAKLFFYRLFFCMVN